MISRRYAETPPDGAADNTDEILLPSIETLFGDAAPFGATVIPFEFVEHVDEFAESNGISRDDAVGLIIRSFFTGEPING